MTTRILLVEDDEAYRYSLAKVLTHAGFETVVAESYLEALAAFENALDEFRKAIESSPSNIRISHVPHSF